MIGQFHFHDEEIIKSNPPPCMSKLLLKYFFDIAEHSICQPGLPFPNLESQLGSLFLLGFHKTKSPGFFLILDISTLEPASRSLIVFFEMLRKNSNLFISKKTWPAFHKHNFYLVMSLSFQSFLLYDLVALGSNRRLQASKILAILIKRECNFIS